MSREHRNVFERLQAGEIIPFDDPQHPYIREAVTQTMKLSAKLNVATNPDRVRELMSKITGTQLDESTTVFIPFHTNVGRFIRLGRNVFINHACSFLDLGGITIEDDVLIGPGVHLTTESHPLDPAHRKALEVKPIRIKRNAWIGAAVTILPGVTVGENAVVAAGAVVTKDVPDNMVVGGIPAKIIRKIGQ